MYVLGIDFSQFGLTFFDGKSISMNVQMDAEIMILTKYKCCNRWLVELLDGFIVSFWPNILEILCIHDAKDNFMRHYIQLMWAQMEQSIRKLKNLGKLEF